MRLLQPIAGVVLAVSLVGCGRSAPSAEPDAGAPPSVPQSSSVDRPAARWRTLPPTPTLPAPTASGYAAVNGVQIWYATFGAGPPVILLHGGLANSNYWGHQVPQLAKTHRVIVMDSRGHGRSTCDAQPFGYELMASDVVALMDALNLPKAAVVGWSDGAIIGLSLAMNHPDRVDRLFAFAANSDPSGVRDVDASPVFTAYLARARTEYEALSATPDDYDAFVSQIRQMWATQPNWSAADLQRIAIPTWIVDGDHDEAITRENTEFIAGAIPGAGLLLQPEVSHFSMLQAPEQFTEDILRLLDRNFG